MTSVRRGWSWKHVGMACALALGGCESGGSSALEVVAPEGCSPSDAAVVYRLTAVRVPTVADAQAGALIGHDLDGVDDACSVEDYEGGVDNSLIAIANALPLLAPEEPVVLQDVMDAALFCTASDEGCIPKWVGVRVQACQRGARVDVFRVTDDACVALGTAETANVGPDGELVANFAAFALSLAFEDAEGSQLPLDLVDARLTATVTSAGLTDAVLGGTIPSDVFDAIIAETLPGTEPPDWEQTPIAGLFDMAGEVASVCDGVSMGLTLSAVVEPAGESCE